MHTDRLINLPDWAKIYLTKHEVFRHATGGFSEDYLNWMAFPAAEFEGEATAADRSEADDRLNAMPGVTAELLDAGKMVFAGLVGLHRAQFQRELSCLYSLRSMQQEALKRTLERQDNEFEETKKRIQNG